MTNKKREMTMKKNLSLPKQILLALVLGVIVGFICDQAGIPQLTTNYLKPFGTIFVNLLKFIVVPVVLLSMIEGILSMGDMKKVRGNRRLQHLQAGGVSGQLPQRRAVHLRH